MSEALGLAAYLERLAARPIPQLTGYDKGRLSEAAAVLRKVEARERDIESKRARRAIRTIKPADRARGPLGVVGSEA